MANIPSSGTSTGFLPHLRLVPPDRPWAWLAAGWGDLLRAPGVSLAYGGAVVIFSYGLLYLLLRTDLLYLLLPMAGAFFLIGPMLAIGLYETSRRLETGRPVSVGAALMAWRGRPQVAVFGVVLLVLHLAWVRTALLLFALFFSGAPVSLMHLVNMTLLSADGLPFLVVGTLIGLGFATVTFMIAAISVPLLLDRGGDVITAVITSIVVVRRNWRAMLLWAVLIVGFTGIGIATAFVGLAVVLPLMGYATWHAYRDLTT